MKTEQTQLKPLNINQLRWISAGIGPVPVEPPDRDYHTALTGPCTCTQCSGGNGGGNSSGG